ncbi:unnamed protein product [Spirodela intermedia]|uniref:Uncharacterized protein n=2 Tax=Spirodela intermedia TaxID=51605 RepID=A0A7I8JUB9_SPIIN|nr:unnamed protein product [Spirodela intermedia]CAA6673052.1 unnamed protein product [Spirodela intermedia]
MERERERKRARNGGELTRTVESLAARARMSAQETVLGHSLSSAALISSTTSNPLMELRLGLESFSLTMLGLLSSRTDASQPFIKKTRHQMRLPNMGSLQSSIIISWLAGYWLARERERERAGTLTKQSWKCSLTRDAAMRASRATAWATTDLTISLALGQDRS